MGRQQRSGRPNDYDWEVAAGFDLARAVGAIVQFEIFATDTAETLMRLRGELLWWLSSSGSTAGDALLVSWGIIRAASGSSDVGVSPITEGGAPWLSFGTATLATEAAVSASSGAQCNGIQQVRFEIDSKAMRKMRENESLYLVAETADIAGAPVTDMSFTLRGLTAR